MRICSILLAVLLAGSLTCLAALPSECAGVAEVAGGTMKSITVAEGFSGRPIAVVSPPQDHERLFFAVKSGTIYFRKRGEPSTQLNVFLDLTSVVDDIYEETGLLGLAFDPEFSETGYFYVNYTEYRDVANNTFRTVVARYKVDPQDPDAGDPTSEFRIIELDQPRFNHNGGHLEFGPDNMLYVGLGDGGGAGDPHGDCGHGQATFTALGAILRLDVRDGNLPGGFPPECSDGAANYEIPGENPFAGDEEGCGEIWSYGLRNPWRFSIDHQTFDFYVADVGQDCWEEINWKPFLQSRGANYGWRQMEGSDCYDPAQRYNCYDTPPTTGCEVPCDSPSLTLPVYEYEQAGSSCTVIGGPVYRGCTLPDLHGSYFFGDYCAGQVWSMEVVGGTVSNLQDRTPEVFPGGPLYSRLLSFGTDSYGEIYVCDSSSVVYKLMPPFTALQVSGPRAVPLSLSKTGDWTWEDLEYTTFHPVDSYKVYRGQPNQTFVCVHQSSSPSWIGGDPTVPNAGEMLAYLVTAVSPSAEETSPGEPATLRDLSPVPCS